jgi:hypothetical protein
MSPHEKRAHYLSCALLCRLRCRLSLPQAGHDLDSPLREILRRNSLSPMPVLGAFAAFWRVAPTSPTFALSSLQTTPINVPGCGVGHLWKRRRSILLLFASWARFLSIRTLYFLLIFKCLQTVSRRNRYKTRNWVPLLLSILSPDVLILK